MDQAKTGAFLKTLRSEKHWTQEQLAETLRVSRRTVSRWETGRNLPDLDILMELADLYGLDLRELLEGEQKEQKMDRELEETVWMVADYSNAEKRRITKILHWMFLIGAASFAAFFILLFAEPDNPGGLYGYFEGLTLGIPFGAVCIGAVMTGKYAAKIRDFKKRHKA